MPATQTTPTVQSTDLTWDPRARRYSAEASDLGFRAGGAPDEVLMVSRAGYEVPLRIFHLEVSEGDLLWIDYTPTHPADRAAFTGVRLYND